jgi:hypothetical protein
MIAAADAVASTAAMFWSCTIGNACAPAVAIGATTNASAVTTGTTPAAVAAAITPATREPADTTGTDAAAVADATVAAIAPGDADTAGTGAAAVAAAFGGARTAERLSSKTRCSTPASSQ